VTEWRNVVSERKRRRATYVMTIAAGILAVVGAWLWSLRPGDGLGASVARVEKIYGRPVSHLPSSQADGILVVSQDLHVGEEVSTGDADLVAVRWRNGAALRLDRGTTISLLADNRLALQQGAVYVDSKITGLAPSENLRENSHLDLVEARQRRTPDLTIQTPAGNVRHLGTQFEARLSSQALRVSVREGRVEIRRSAPTLGASAQATNPAVDRDANPLAQRTDDVQVVEAGERLTLGPDGQRRSQFISPHDPEWNWISRVAPTFVIDRRPLKEFLAWVGRELGQEIIFADARSESLAKTVILRGSIDGLTPEQALPAVLSTTKLHLQHRDDKIVIVADGADRQSF